MKRIIDVSILASLLGSIVSCPLQAGPKENQFNVPANENDIAQKISQKFRNMPSKKRRKAIQSAIDKEKAKMQRNALVPVPQAQGLLPRPELSFSSAATAATISHPDRLPSPTLSGDGGITSPILTPPSVPRDPNIVISVSPNLSGASTSVANADEITRALGRFQPPRTYSATLGIMMTPPGRESAAAGRQFISSKPATEGAVSPNAPFPPRHPRPQGRRSSIDGKYAPSSHTHASSGGHFGTSDRLSKGIVPFEPPGLIIPRGTSPHFDLVPASSSRSSTLHSPLPGMMSAVPSPSARSGMSSPVPLSGGSSPSTALIPYAVSSEELALISHTKRELDKLDGLNFHLLEGLRGLIERLEILQKKAASFTVGGDRKSTDIKTASAFGASAAAAGDTVSCSAGASAAAAAAPQPRKDQIVVVSAFASTSGSGGVPSATPLIPASPSTLLKDKTFVVDLHPTERNLLIAQAMALLDGLRASVSASQDTAVLGSIDRLRLQLQVPDWYAQLKLPLFAELVKIFNLPLAPQAEECNAPTLIPRGVLSIVVDYVKSPIILPSAELFRHEISLVPKKQSDGSWRCEHRDDNIIRGYAGFNWVPHLPFHYWETTPKLESEPTPPNPQFTLLYNPEKSDSIWTPSNKPQRANFCLAQYEIVSRNNAPWNQHSLFATLRLEGLANRMAQGLKFKKLLRGFVSERPTDI